MSSDSRVASCYSPSVNDDVFDVSQCIRVVLNEICCGVDVVANVYVVQLRRCLALNVYVLTILCLHIK